MGPSCDREAILDWVWGTAGLLCTAFSLLTNNKRAITGCHVTAPPPPILSNTSCCPRLAQMARTGSRASTQSSIGSCL